jgi:hypothetical protein
MVLGACSSESSRRETSDAKDPASAQATGAARIDSEPVESVGIRTASGQLRTGMTYDQAVALLGEPTTKVAFDAGQGEAVQCSWQKGDTTLVAHFQDGRATLVHQGTESGEAAVADSGKVKANFSKVKIGMSEAEVHKLLGPPTNSFATGAEDMAMTVKTWELDGATYVVSFMNGKVQMTHMDKD